ncbi:MAG: glycosyltransferase [Acidobacteriota bacterium]
MSPSLAALLTERHGRRGAWTVIGNVVDEGFFQPGEPAPAPDGPFRFLAIGSLDENKAHADLLRAFARAFSGEAGTTLRIGGAGPQRTALEALAGALGVASRVSFLGTLSRDGVRAEMQRAGAVILPSRYETFGVVLIEALACGVPVVATRCGGPESIVTEQNGILVPARDPEALATALSRMRAEAGRHDRAAIRADCVARFGRAAFTSAAGALYERVLATRR